MSLVQNSFNLNLIIMRLLGLYPPESRKTLFKLHTYFIYFLIIIPFPILAILNFTLEDIGFQEVIDNGFLVFQVANFILKFMPFVFTNYKIKALINYMENPIFNAVNLEQEMILKECVKSCRKISWWFMYSVWGSILFWSIGPIFLEGSRFPVDVWLPFDPYQNMAVFVGVYIYIVFAGSIGGNTSGAIDPLMAGIACHIGTQFKILKNNLENLSKHAEEELVKNYCNKTLTTAEAEAKISEIIYQKITKCAIHQLKILRIVKLYEECFSFPIFTQLLVSSVVICISCLQLGSIGNIFSVSFVFMIFYIICMLLEIYLYCYYGTMIYEESNNIVNSIYMSNWYEFDLRSRKALIIVMNYSQEAVVVRAAKLLDISLTTFSQVLRRAYSLIAVLKNFNN